MSPDLLALPSLRQQAARDAIGWNAMMVDSDAKRGVRLVQPWDRMVDSDRTAYVSAHAVLLADLTRWQSQAWALRRIGELLGWDIGDRVPYLTLELERGWIVSCQEDDTKFPKFYIADRVTGNLTDRASVVAAILLHLENRS